LGTWLLSTTNGFCGSEPNLLLEPVIKHLRLMATMLNDATADHYAVAHDLGVIIAQLMAVDDLRLVKPMMDIERARQKILGRQN
jgi:hypothetical protein